MRCTELVPRRTVGLRQLQSDRQLAALADSARWESLGSSDSTRRVRFRRIPGWQIRLLQQRPQARDLAVAGAGRGGDRGPGIEPGRPMAILADHTARFLLRGS